MQIDLKIDYNPTLGYSLTNSSNPKYPKSLGIALKYRDLVAKFIESQKLNPCSDKKYSLEITQKARTSLGKESVGNLEGIIKFYNRINDLRTSIYDLDMAAK